MVIPYPHQEEALDAIDQAWASGRNRGLVIMASGLGKTILSALTFRKLCKRKPGSRLLFLCHQNDILEQAKLEYEEVLSQEYTYGFFTGDDKVIPHECDCLFASFQTMHKWRKHFGPEDFDFVVVDESHHTHATTYLPTIRYFKPEFMLGITATPDRTDLQDIRQVYGQEIFNLDLPQAMARELLAPADYRLLVDEIRRNGIIDTPEGEFSIAQLNRHLFVPRRDQEIVEIIRRHTVPLENPRTIIFCQSIRYCNRLEKLIDGAKSIHSDVEKGERKERLKRFRREGGTLLVVDIFNEGIDIPSINVIVFLRLTASTRIFYQQLGRGLRKYPGKDKVIVLDLVGNIERIEMINQLKRAVERERKEIERKTCATRTRGTLEPLEVSVGNVEFEEFIVPLLERLSHQTGRYNQAQLIRQLQDLAQDLGWSPSASDIAKASKEGRCASLTSFVKHFGSFENAKGMAGLERAWTGYTKKDLIVQLRTLYRKLGRCPTTCDVEEASQKGEFADPNTFTRHFGTLNKAKIAAGLKIPGSQGGYSREVLKNQLRGLAKELGRTPKVADFVRAKRAKPGAYAALETFLNNFGSWGEAQEAAGLESTRRGPQRAAGVIRTRWKKTYTDEKLINHYLALRGQLGRWPTWDDIRTRAFPGQVPGPSAYIVHFSNLGNLRKMLEVKARERKEGD